MAKHELAKIADDLQMYASQIREHLKGEGDLPATWWIDDLVERYRTAVRAATKSPNAVV